MDKIKIEVEWIPVTERLPEDGEVVLAWSLTTDELVICGYDSGEESPWTLEDGLDTSIEISHWMPLLSSPVSLKAM